MPEINRSALVTYTPAQMYDLVRDVERYPDFLSWIVAARILEESETHQLASLDVSVAGIARRIVTRNDLVSGELLRLNLAEGPFRHFAGEWR
ncbi:MAG: type II toxin-antitoxin system RatA family toxin, partial [Wenzhouxiangellaceae bacterium]